jgi:hypothetical protein
MITAKPPGADGSGSLTRSRARVRGSVVTETLVIIGLLGLGAAGAFVTAGARLHAEYREHRASLASPFP